MKTVAERFRMLAKQGLASTLSEYSFRLYTKFSDFRLGVSTSGYLDEADLGYDNNEHLAYMPVGHAGIRKAIKSLNLNWSECSFLDFGCGKGRALFVASAFNFKRIIGIDLSQKLIDTAKKNLHSKKGRKDNIHLECVDATQYTIPDDVNVVYFFNPFWGEVLQKVIDNLIASADRKPRDIHIIYFSHHNFDPLVAGNDRIKKVKQDKYRGIGFATYLLPKTIPLEK